MKTRVEKSVAASAVLALFSSKADGKRSSIADLRSGVPRFEPIPTGAYPAGHFHNEAVEDHVDRIVSCEGLRLRRAALRFTLERRVVPPRFLQGTRVAGGA